MDDVVEEELLALESIFYDSYSKINENRFRLRIDPSVDDEGDEVHSVPPLFLDIELPAGYPEKVPHFDLSNLNNNTYPDFVKKAIIEGLEKQAAEQLGESMCYALVEWLKEKLPEFYATKPAVTIQDDKDSHDDSVAAHEVKNTGKKEHKDKDKLTKAQKRRFYDKFGANAEKPRGWNWVQIISHLSQVPQHAATS